MWRIVCIGPGPLDRERRIVDRGPLHADRQRALSFAEFLRATGLYESVKVVGSTVARAAIGTPGATPAAFAALDAEPLAPGP